MEVEQGRHDGEGKEEDEERVGGKFGAEVDAHRQRTCESGACHPIAGGGAQDVQPLMKGREELPGLAAKATALRADDTR